jgi:hypothetical protein
MTLDSLVLVGKYLQASDTAGRILQRVGYSRGIMLIFFFFSIGIATATASKHI